MSDHVELTGRALREVRLRQRSRLPKLAQMRRQGPMDIKGHFLMRQVTISTAFAAGLVFSSGATGQTSGLAIAAQQPASVISTAPARPVTQFGRPLRGEKSPTPTYGRTTKGRLM